MKKVFRDLILLFVSGFGLALLGMWIYPHQNIFQYIIILLMQLSVWLFVKTYRINRK